MVRKSFYDWLLSQETRNDLIGDLARDIKRDREFPIRAASLDELMSYFSKGSVPDLVINAVKTAYTEYSRQGKETQPTA